MNEKLSLDNALMLGIEAHKSGKLEEADRFYTAILKVHAKHPDANHNMGIIAVGMGKIEEALRYLKTAIESNSNIEQFWISYIDALIKIGKSNDAKKMLHLAKNKFPHCKILSDFEKTLNSSENPVQTSLPAIDPPQTIIKNLVALYNNGRFEQVLKNINTLILQFPKSPILNNILGASYLGRGDLEKAKLSYSEAIKLNPEFAEAHNNISVIFKAQGQVQEALKSCSRALELNPNYTDALNNIAILLTQQGKIEEAIAYLKKLSNCNQIML